MKNSGNDSKYAAATYSPEEECITLPQSQEQAFTEDGQLVLSVSVNLESPSSRKKKDRLLMDANAGSSARGSVSAWKTPLQEHSLQPNTSSDIAGEVRQSPHSAASRPTDRFQLVYPYTPLEEHFLDVDAVPQYDAGQTHPLAIAAEKEEGKEEGKLENKKTGQQEEDSKDTTKNSSDDDSSSDGGEGVFVPLGCSKTGLWNLRYKEEAMSREFMRFCHLALDGAVAMLIFLLASVGFIVSGEVESVSYVIVISSTISYSICLAWEVTLHLWKGGGTSYEYRHALMRQVGHCFAGLLMVTMSSWHLRGEDLECAPDANYVSVHGHEASPTANYRGCVNHISTVSSVIPLVGMVTVRMDIHVHFVATFVYTLLLMLPYLSVFGSPSTPDLIWYPTTGSIVARAVMALAAMTLSNLVAYAKHRSLQQGFEAAMDVHYQMRASKRRMEAVDSLMTSMVPSSALGRLVSGEAVFDSAPEATVLFSDMVQFTRWSSVKTPQEVVAMMSVLIRSFDVLAADMDVSKIKTIGDCYWAVTGIPDRMDNHAEVMIKFGLAMLDRVRKEAKAHREWDYPAVEGVHNTLNTPTSRPLQFRTGIHSGPVEAGVLGTQQISYEIFGETSFDANEVESKSQGDRVVVSATTKRLVEDNLTSSTSFSFVPHTQVVPTRLGPESDADEEAGLLFFVTHKVKSRKSSVHHLRTVGSSGHLTAAGGTAGEETISIIGSNTRTNLSSSNVITADDENAGLDAPAAKARAQRKRFVNKQLVKRRLSQGEMEGGLSEVSREGLLKEYLDRNPTCCVRQFARLGFEEEYQWFAILYGIDFRVGGSAACFGFFTLAFLVMLADASPTSIPAPTILVMLLSQGMMLVALCLAMKRRSGIIRERRTVSSIVPMMDYLGPALQWTASPMWMLSAILVPESIVTNSLVYLGPVAILILVMPNVHLPTGFAMLGVYGSVFAIIIHTFVRGRSISNPVVFIGFGTLCCYMLSRMLETRVRMQFIENKVAAHFSKQQDNAVKAQTAVLTSMLPDFVIAPLTTWISSNFDPAKAVVQSHSQISIAFIRMSDGAVLTPRRIRSGDFSEVDAALKDKDSDDGSAGTWDWLFSGHIAVDAILGTTKVVDKVKTVGDLIIVAGSFRGHTPEKAAATLLSVALRIHGVFDSECVTIGLHVGPVMATVLGFSRLSFDVFGDAVNTASRVLTADNSLHRVNASSDFIDLLPSAPYTLRHGHQKKGSAWEGETIEYGPICQVAAKGKGFIGVSEIQHSY